MEGFRYFTDTTSQNPIPHDQSLEAAFSRLNVSSFNQPPPFSGADYSSGSAPKYPSRRNELMPGGFDGGDFGHLGLEDCWVGSDTDHGLGGFGSSLHKPSDWSQEPLNSLSVADLRGKIASLSMDQYGCRFFQRAMEDEPKEFTDMIFEEVVDHVAHLILDPYGNYVVQKLVEVCSEEQRTQILLRWTKNPFHFITLCLHSRGTRSVLKLLKKITTREQISVFVSALSCGAVDLSMNINGQHIMEYCLKNFSDEHKRCLLNVVIDNCIGIAKDKVGCCVLQQCVDYCYGETKGRLIAAIIEDALILAQDRYGNYVLQHLLGLRAPQVTSNLLRQFQGNYMFLSCSKYGSNVVEKCLLESGEEQSAEIIRELCRSPNLSMLLMHPFGNYVFQTALSVSKGLTHKFLLSLVQHYTPALLSNQYGKRVLAWRERNLRRM
ncbi:putative armadillo-like helical protein [Rosa chinensis]|uniref:Putative armadillo-like helical protein n=1 Tax=Rosa chinensis TaxID=74649 RepID=A0A2P6Q0U6_ROSCH|nr:pumilio homolog 12 [Rosa chinensis]PRQ27794.1 putative armadillo-like helical protein [Rosa chinensis]